MTVYTGTGMTTYTDTGIKERDLDTKLVDDSREGYKHCYSIYTIDNYFKAGHMAHGYTKAEAVINWLESQIAEIKRTGESYPFHLEKVSTWNEDAWKRGQETLRKKREAKKKLAQQNRD